MQLKKAAKLVLFGSLSLHFIFLRSTPCAAQTIDDFKPVWDQYLKTTKTFVPEYDMNLPDQDSDWWTISLDKDRLRTSHIRGFVGLQFVRAWLDLPSSRPLDPLDGGSNTLQIQLDMDYDKTSSYTYSFRNSSVIGGANETVPTRFLVPLPQSMIIIISVPDGTTVQNAATIFGSFMSHPGALSMGFYEKRISINLPTWKISTAVQPTYLLGFYFAN